MQGQIITFVALERFASLVAQNTTRMSGFFQNYFVGAENLRIVSVILLLLAFILFLFLIVVVYIKSLLSFIKESEGQMASGGQAQANTGIDDSELEKELEKELERDLEVSRICREMNPQKKDSSRTKKRKQESSERLQDKQATLQNDVATGSKAAQKEFDWRTGRVEELDEALIGMDVSPAKRGNLPISALTGLIVDMLGRGIDAGKIAQTIKSKAAPFVSEEDIIQTVDAIKSFISLANNGKFAALENRKLLPEPEDALMQLSKGKADEVLCLMEALINTLVDKAAQASIPQKHDLFFLEASNYACIFGSFAMVEQDSELAISAFELAVELSPKNANAWSRSGDAHRANKSDSKAMLAYQNVLALADENLYPHQIANANKNLAVFYQNQGDNTKASLLRSEAEKYYNTVGINKELSGREQNIIEIIESKLEENISESINKLLSLSRQKHQARSYI